VAGGWRIVQNEKLHNF